MTSDQELRLDGNAAAGLLQELFVHEITAARGACASCGAVGEMGAQHLYMFPLSPGAVLRCAACESVLMVVVRADGRFRMGLQGLVWLEMQDVSAAS
ncbi:MAG: DUF6510 family protein [Candidatus Dormibacteria bacterium]